eukprot:CAMPEP_0175054520 /NCGR_PEP_ID=MMETSP0052_2-20121109/9551_1 /TAXON_ID=51329 ORGANISM="Polytomella parva, Strain SAG 63-3" /NCGR_SAMPLE_ID=MMETSP0052_2 /ASSEMBLY_ACC=CAM_ASM_000194 /LENGTH=273 /DNA_ID=CAMNT_0016319225 /DNA_START=35 /DNA_END=857 /DNA_ORIENTATION=+
MSNKDVDYLSDAYKLLRPTYPEQKTSVPRMQLLNKLYDVAVDVATGTGQVVTSIASRFRKVLATDKSDTQLALADPFPNVEYKCCDASSIDLPTGSVDLVTVGQAIHWFDVEAFYREAIRVLKPNSGVLAFWTYDLGVLDKAGSEEDLEFLKVHKDTLGPYWLPGMSVAMNGYKDLKPNVEDFFEHVERHDLLMDDTPYSAEQIAGYVRSWSGYRDFRLKNPDVDPAESLLRALKDIIETRQKERKSEHDDTVIGQFIYRRKLTLVIAYGPKV